MPLKKLQFKPGINKEVTGYSSEGGWEDCDKVRFRQGFPEKIGGWQRISDNTFLGVCRALFSWSALNGLRYRAVGTHLKYYVELGGAYTDITPLRLTTSAGATTFDCTSGSSTVTVNHISHGAGEGDFVTFSSAATLGASNITATVLNKEYQVLEVIDADTYTFTALDGAGDELVADATVSGGGGASTVAEYQITIGRDIESAASGWGSGAWSSGTWGNTSSSFALAGLRSWSQYNFGEDLVFSYNRGPLYYWDTSAGGRAVEVDSLAGASNVPITQRLVFVSDINRFVFALGTNPLGDTVFDPMLIRWSDQEDVTNWTPAPTNQAGSIRLSRGGEIVAVDQSRQEILVWTDSSLYSLQFVGAPIVWGTQLIADTINIASSRATVYANGMIFWMGTDQFFRYDGRVQHQPCSLLRYVFSDINKDQLTQVFSGSNEEFNEVWWFYPSTNSERPDRYVIYNYIENIWYHGNLERSAWDENNTLPYLSTYDNNIVEHEVGCDDRQQPTVRAINSQITSSQMDIDDGDRFSFIWRMLPDLTFDSSTAVDPQATMTVYGLRNAGAGYKNPASMGGVNNANVTKVASANIEQFTQQLSIRVRGRQLVLKVSSEEIGTKWQLGSPRIDMRTDGKR